MEMALNSYGKRIRAGSANRGERYQCAECKVRVILHRGVYRVDHFKHSPASSTDRHRCEKCTLYISDHGGGIQEPALPKPRVRPPVKALLAVGWKQAADGPERWSLYVSVPIPPKGIEQVWVEGNINGEIWLDRRIIDKQRHIPVRVAEKQYSCRHRPSVTTSGGNYVVQPTDLIERDRANIFAAGTRGGVQLEGHESLVRGRCYFALSMPNVWRPPPRANTTRAIPSSRDCDPQGAWQGHLIYVPMSPDRQFDAWCQSVCKRKVVVPPDDIDLLYPPLLDTRPDGTLVVAYGEPLIFALSGRWDHPEFEIWQDDAAFNPVVEQLSVFDGDRVAITNLPKGLFSIYATGTRRVLVRVEVAIAVDPIIPAFTICTHNLATGEELRGDLHHQDGVARWSGLMSGSEGWGGIAFPQGWLVKFCYRQRNEKQNRTLSVTTPTELVTLIGECLAADPLAASVDAGIFGEAHWESPNPVPTPQRIHKDISRQLRERIKWLLTYSATQVEKRTQPTGILPPTGWDTKLDPHDFAVVARFLKTPRWPEPLLSHARSVTKDLCETLKT